MSKLINPKKVKLDNIYDLCEELRELVYFSDLKIPYIEFHIIHKNYEIEDDDALKENLNKFLIDNKLKKPKNIEIDEIKNILKKIAFDSFLVSFKKIEMEYDFVKFCLIDYENGEITVILNFELIIEDRFKVKYLVDDLFDCYNQFNYKLFRTNNLSKMEEKLNEYIFSLKKVIRKINIEIDKIEKIENIDDYLKILQKDYKIFRN